MAEPPQQDRPEHPTVAREPSAERRAEVEARMAELRRGLAEGRRTQGSNPRARLRMVGWTLVLIPLLALARPDTVGARGPRTVLVEGAGTVGGQRLEEPGDTARVGPGDVLVAAPGGELLLQVGDGAVQVRTVAGCSSNGSARRPSGS